MPHRGKTGRKRARHPGHGRLSYFDPEFKTMAVKIVAGEFYATDEAVAITTVLGSCVSVCLYDVELGIGGMNHFMLPELQQGGSATPCSGVCNDDSQSCARYGSCAMRRLLEQLELLGANRKRLAAKLFGAGHVMESSTDIGGNNAAFAVDYLKKQGIPIVASDLGECCPRKVMFFPKTGRALVKRIRALHAGRN
ncbi:histidine kinase [Geomonas paludis]|uniref:Probable chemoreceptor glutamine deamidase CheD n=2 Tax=Geomonas paludis TaxID=2740185 RepID=A0A6V8MXT3_9BACT|nr:histidine kinase [Geomonas paludis]UPU37016.1 histidine kinase [Geomonas paludis]GFO64890.1 putative chemoreceptor glutamine deamidase CheD [Geomonas paludis]